MILTDLINFLICAWMILRLEIRRIIYTSIKLRIKAVILWLLFILFSLLDHYLKWRFSITIGLLSSSTTVSPLFIITIRFLAFAPKYLAFPLLTVNYRIIFDLIPLTLNSFYGSLTVQYVNYPAKPSHFKQLYVTALQLLTSKVVHVEVYKFVLEDMLFVLGGVMILIYIWTYIFSPF